MEPKLSVNLTPSVPPMPGQPWTASTTPSLKLISPTPPSATEWRNPLSAQPLSAQPTPRYSPPFLLASPGVSGEIAGAVDQPATTHSLSDLFSAPEYPISSVKTSPPPPAPVTPTPAKRPTSANPIPPPALRPPQPPPLQPTSQPLVSAQKPPTPMSYPTTLRVPSITPTLPMSQSLHHPANSAPTVSYPQPVSSAALTQTITTPTPPTQATSQTYAGYSMLPPSQHPQAPPAPPQPPRVEPVIAPQPPRLGVPAVHPVPDASTGITASDEAMGKVPVAPVGVKEGNGAMVMPTTGHRSVLGSGIVSSAVQEAQVKARLKAETFAKNRKRKRSDDVDQPDVGAGIKEDKTEEDGKLSPEELRKKRYMRRLALNRESAAVSRVRRREYVKLLEEQLVKAEKERMRLATELSEMQKRHAELRDQLTSLEVKVQGSDGGEPARF